MTVSISAFSSYPLGKREKAKPSLGGSPAQGSTAACHRNLSCHKHGAVAAFQQRHAVDTSHICLEHQSHPWRRQAHGSTLQHTAREDGKSGTTLVPRETFLCQSAILPGQSQRAH